MNLFAEIRPEDQNGRALAGLHELLCLFHRGNNFDLDIGFGQIALHFPGPGLLRKPGQPLGDSKRHCRQGGWRNGALRRSRLGRPRQPGCCFPDGRCRLGIADVQVDDRDM